MKGKAKMIEFKGSKKVETVAAENTQSVEKPKDSTLNKAFNGDEI